MWRPSLPPFSSTSTSTRCASPALVRRSGSVASGQAAAVVSRVRRAIRAMNLLYLINGIGEQAAQQRAAGPTVEHLGVQRRERQQQQRGCRSEEHTSELKSI